VKRRERKIRGKSSRRSTTVLRDEKGWPRKANQPTKTRSLLATTTHASEQAAEAAPEVMRFVQNNSLREIVEDAPSICERQSQRNHIGNIWSGLRREKKNAPAIAPIPDGTRSNRWLE
jgi:hypothetical protein